MAINDVAITHFVHQGAQVPTVSQSSRRVFSFYTKGTFSKVLLGNARVIFVGYYLAVIITIK